MAVKEDHVVHQRASRYFSFDQVMAEQPPAGQPALKPVQPQRRIVDPLAHKGTPAEHILIHVLNGQAVRVRAAWAPKQSLAPGHPQNGLHLHPGLDHGDPILLQGMLHGPHQAVKRAGGQEGVRVQGDHIGPTAPDFIRLQGHMQKIIRARALGDQKVQAFQRAPLPFPACVGPLDHAEAPGPVQVIKSAAVPPVQQFDGFLHAG